MGTKQDNMSISTSAPVTIHHQRTPRTPESYFNVPESIALLNIVKSERIQCAFQSNRKNHASVWEMVANILNRYSNRKRSAKQCCNRYENLKKIYTQLKRNPEKHVRRNWPYMYLFREIEEQRGETWGSNGKRNAAAAAAANLVAAAAATVALNGINNDNIGFGVSNTNILDGNNGVGVSSTGNTDVICNDNAINNTGMINNTTISLKNQIKNELNYYQRRRNAAALTNMLLNREVMLTNINVNNNHNNNNSNNSLIHQRNNINNCSNSSSNNNDLSVHERNMIVNNFVETEINDCDDDDDVNLIDNCAGVVDGELHHNGVVMNSVGSVGGGGVGSANDDGGIDRHNAFVNNGVGNIDLSTFGIDGPSPIKKLRTNQEFGLPDFLSTMKDEPTSDQEDSDHEANRNSFLNNNYNGNPEIYMNGHQNILHPDVIVDTDPVTDSSSLSLHGIPTTTTTQTIGKNKHKRSLTCSDDPVDDDDDDDDGGGSSTNYELIEYLRRREKRDEHIQRRMDEREDRLMKLLERTVVAIEKIASQSCTHNSNSNNNNNVSSNNSSNNNNNNVNNANANFSSTEMNTKKSNES